MPALRGWLGYLLESKVSQRSSMKKPETIFVCQSCGNQSRKWLGKCSECGEWNSLVEERARTPAKGRTQNGFKMREVAAVAYEQIESQDETRVSSGVAE